MSKVILEGRCPRCHKGNIFKHPIGNISKFAEMNKECPHCKLRFEVEPGFFFGAMYISYAITVGLLLTTGLVLYLLEVGDIFVYISSVVVVVLLFLPLVFRYSRILFLHWFGGVAYDQSY